MRPQNSPFVTSIAKLMPNRMAVAVVVLISTLLSTTQYSQALEYTGGAHLTKASLNTAIHAPIQNSAGLFGASEKRYSDIKAFTKWNGVLDRFKNQLMTSMNQPETRKWMEFLLTQQGKPKAEQIEAVNQYLNQIKFVPDSQNYSANDYWATPMEFLANGGDCEDYAVAKYISLAALGFSKDEMRLVVVNDRVMRTPHAMLAVFEGSEAKILDNQNPAVVVSSEISRYVPVYSISQVAWWRH